MALHVVDFNIHTTAAAERLQVHSMLILRRRDFRIPAGLQCVTVAE
jgi:hypothetical protein